MNTLVKIPLLVLAFLLTHSCLLAGGGLYQTKEIEAPENREALYAKALYSDSNSSVFIIWIDSTVADHFHEWHTEKVYIIEGTGIMRLGDVYKNVKAGDFIIIPPRTPHGVKVTSESMKVISIQSPEFKGKDRVLLNE